MNKNKVAGLTVSVLLATPVGSWAQDITKSVETIETLQRQLAAQQAINQQLRQRVETLERGLSANRKSDAPLIVGLDTRAPPPKDLSVDDKPITAIEEALGNKGLVLLPTGFYRVTPSMSWAHSGSGSNSYASYSLGTLFEAGLPMGMAVALRQPYIWSSSGYGSSRGSGDLSVSLAKKLANETATTPAIVAKLGYTHNNGKDPFTIPSFGGGFRAVDLGISGVKRFDPIVVYANASYSRASGTFASLQYKNQSPYFTGTIKPGESYGLGFGVSLAATPEVSLDAGFSLSVAGKARFIDTLGNTSTGTQSTVGYLNLGTNFLISRNLSLSISAAAGVTKDANDLALTIAFPYRF